MNSTDYWGNAVLLQKHEESFESHGWILSGQPLYIFSIFKYKCFAYSSFMFQELEALRQLSETSSFLTQTVQQLQTDKRYWSKGEKHTLRESCLGYLGFE